MRTAHATSLGLAAALLLLSGRAHGQAGQMARKPSDRTTTLVKMKQVAISIIMASADDKDRFPKATSTAGVKRAVAPYLRNPGAWTTNNPNGGQILYNTALSGKSMQILRQPAETVLLWEERAWADGSRAVAFADGHVKFLPEAQWKSLWSAEIARRTAAKVRKK